MTNVYRAESESDQEGWNDFDRKWIPVALKLHAVNVRVLDGVDVGALPESEKSDAMQWPPFYENP